MGVWAHTGERQGRLGISQPAHPNLPKGVRAQAGEGSPGLTRLLLVFLLDISCSFTFSSGEMWIIDVCLFLIIYSVIWLRIYLPATGIFSD